MKRRPMANPHLDDDDVEEDEETLQLQLAAIEARLKLKKLQQAKARSNEDGGTDDSVRTSSRPGTAASSRRVELPPPDAVQVPMSPVRNRRPIEVNKSPVRVMLGIDKGLRAQDVSLKRATSTQSRSGARDGSRPFSRAEPAKAAQAPIKTFSEKMAEARLSARQKEEKQTRIEKSRSRGFGLNTGKSGEGLSAPPSRVGSAMSEASTGRSARQQKDMAPPSRTPSRATSGLKSRSAADLKSPATSRPPSTLSTRSDSFQSQSSTTSRTPSSLSRTNSASDATDDTATDAPSGFESFSGLHLAKRDIAHTTLTRTLEGKTIYTIPQLLKIVKSPEYNPPDVEGDFVVMGVIASQSATLETKPGQGKFNADGETSTRDKFMVIRLTDLKWELDLYLFNTGFSKYYKMSTGTLVAILNPDIMPPRNKDTGKFSLKLTSSDDTVLEIGVARDLGACNARRRDGTECGQWIDARKTEVCDFHIELAVDKARRGRMEIATMSGFGKGKSGGRGGKGKNMDGFGRVHDSSLHETMYIAPKPGDAVRLLDDSGRTANRAEMHRKRLAEQEKERELAKKLGAMGNGAGSAYLKIHSEKSTNPTPRIQADSTGSSQADTKAPGLSEQVMGLLGKRAEDVSLSPVKRKRTISTKSQEPVGWGGANKRGLLLPKEEEKQTTRETSPAKKKARFMLENKGIREPGRESLGGLDVGLIAAMDNDDSDSGLDII